MHAYRRSKSCCRGLRGNCKFTRIHTHIHICMHTVGAKVVVGGSQGLMSVHTCIHTCMHTVGAKVVVGGSDGTIYVHTYNHTYMHTAGADVGCSKGLQFYTHAYMHAYIHTYIYAYRRGKSCCRGLRRNYNFIHGCRAPRSGLTTTLYICMYTCVYVYVYIHTSRCQ